MNKSFDDNFAQYGTDMISAANLATLRGTGNFNPGPNHIQTINRGPTFTNALNYYENNNGGQNYYNADQNLKNSIRAKTKDPIYQTDLEDRRPYVVGTSLIHPEVPGSWSNQTFQCMDGSSEYVKWAQNSLQMQPNALMIFFFSKENIEYLQNQMIKEVKRIKNTDIAKQSVDELLIIMRAKFIYALSGWLPYGNQPAVQDKVFARGTIMNYTKDGQTRAYSSDPNDGASLTNQIERLNRAVLEECIKSILSGIDMYKKYYEDKSSLPMPLSRPVLTSEKGSRVLQTPVGFESGHPFTKAVDSYNERYNII